MASLSVGLPNAEPKREFAIELGMREVKLAAAIQPLHQKLIGLILTGLILTGLILTGLTLISLTLISMTSCAQPEANKIELGGRGEFEARIIAHPGGKLLGQAHVLANVVLQAFDPVMPDHEPKLERAKAASELDVPVAIINDRA